MKKSNKTVQVVETSNPDVTLTVVETPPQNQEQKGMSPEADQFLKSLVQLRAEGKIPSRQKLLGGQVVGLYAPEVLLPILKAEGIQVPSKEVLIQVSAAIPGVRVPARWATEMVKAQVSMQVSNLRAQYPL